MSETTTLAPQTGTGFLLRAGELLDVVRGRLSIVAFAPARVA